MAFKAKFWLEIDLNFEFLTRNRLKVNLGPLKITWSRFQAMKNGLKYYLGPRNKLEVDFKVQKQA